MFKKFKEDAVKLTAELGYQISEEARNLGINENVAGAM
jgi:transposase-like protein